MKNEARRGKSVQSPGRPKTPSLGSSPRKPWPRLTSEQAADIIVAAFGDQVLKLVRERRVKSQKENTAGEQAAQRKSQPGERLSMNLPAPGTRPQAGLRQ